MKAILREDGTPDLGVLTSTFQRCSPTVQGGLTWIDDTRFCRWENQWTDGRKHDIGSDPDGGARPWNGASDCRPFLVDAVINERVAMKTTAFWRAMMRPGGSADEASNFAVTLAEHLVGNVLYDDLTREVELAAQYEEHYGWMILAPRWRRELGLRRHTVKIEMLQQTPELLAAVLDPLTEDAAVAFFTRWYAEYVQAQLPEDMRERAPQVRESQVRKVVRDLRTKGTASAPLPFLAKNEPAIAALKPWDEVFVPPWVTDEQQIVFQRELIGEADLRSRVIAEGYNEKWVEAVLEHKGDMQPFNLPVGTGGNALSRPSYQMQYPDNSGSGEPTGLVEILYAIYRAPDADDVPAVWMTVFHRTVTRDSRSHGDLYGKHELIQSPHGELPYVAGAREWWCRSISSSRGVPEVAHTQQNLVKGLLDGMVDRESITLLPPVNVYESPTGTKYRFGPATQNYVRQGREPAFMQMPSGQGVVDAIEAHNMVRKLVDNYFGLLAEDVPPARVQMSQAMAVQRFLLVWSKAIQQVLCLCQQQMPDDEFAKITGAPPGWLEARRPQGNLLRCELHFDVRELDPELVMKQIEAVNKVVLPTDVMGTISRGKWAAAQMRMINPALAKELVMPQADASQAIYDRAKLELLNMFAGTPPKPVDKDDPTAKGLLDATVEVLKLNSNFQKALTDEALAELTGNPQMAQQAGQQLDQAGGRRPDPIFSGLLMEWVKNLKFVGVTQPQNRQIGRIGVNPNAD